MLAEIALGITAFVLCLITTPICREIFFRLKILDYPDEQRKLHSVAVPRVGGIAIAFSYALALGLLLAFAPHGMRIFIRHKALLLALLPPACIVFATGLVDDLIGLKPFPKLAGQAVGAALAVTFGARITLVGGTAASVWITLPLSFFWLLACTNALNLIDGLDGLATGVGLFATLTTLLAAILQHNAGLIMATIPLACCLLAFLRYNFNPASVFLGDCGSLTIGFLLGSFALIWSQKSATLLGMAAPLMVLALPLLEVGLSVGRRYLTSKPIFGADRGHIHHRLLALGCTPRDAALVLYGVCGVAAILSLLQSVISNRYQGLIVIVFCGLALFGVKRLDYVEFRAAKELLSQRTFLRVLQERMYLDSLNQALNGAPGLDACWDVIYSTCDKLGFASVAMEFEGRCYAGVLEVSDEHPAWAMTLTLGRRGMLRLTRLRESESPALMMLSLLAMRESLCKRGGLPPEPSAEHRNQLAVSGAA
jgi:UDP-GlcNAc:undecaprenyl-phosphate GlcNAc-1-phosphate transferase